MLVFYKTEHPICLIDSGQLEGRIIYLDPDAKDISDIQQEITSLEGKRSKLDDISAMLFYSVIKGEINQPDTKKEVDALKKEFKKRLSMRIGKDFKSIDSGQLIPLPDIKGRINMYIAGPEDCGKSSLCYLIAKSWQEMNPNGRIYIITEKKEDVVHPNPIDRLKSIRIKTDIDTLKNIDIDILKGNLVIFDDIDALPKGGRNKAKNSFELVLALLTYCIDVGRADNINVISTSHILFDGRDTRRQLLGARQVVIFPRFSHQPQIKRYIKEYMGITEKTLVDKILKSPRWVLHGIRHPKYIMNEQEVFLY
jgi:hypothetical protein